MTDCEASFHYPPPLGVTGCSGEMDVKTILHQPYHYLSDVLINLESGWGGGLANRTLSTMFGSVIEFSADWGCGADG